jgi:Carboxypeptidase regulatory-like domain
MSFILRLLSSGPRVAKPATTRCHSSPAIPLAVLVMTVVLGGCGTVSKNSTPAPSSPSAPGSPSTGSFTISGAISPASAGSGASLTLSGPATANVTADTSGNYSFTGLVNGTYVVTPTHSGFSFSPTLQTVTLNGANATSINFAASQQAPHSVALSWHASSSAVSGYNVYRATTNGGPYSKINSGLITVASYTDTSVSGGTTYYYVSTSVDSAGIESAYSNQAAAAIP